MVRNIKYDHNVVVTGTDDATKQVSKDAWNDGHDELGMFGHGTPTTLTIATGAITPISSMHLINGEVAAPDNLDSITNTETADRDELWLIKGTEVITVRDNSVSGGNIFLLNGNTILLDVNKPLRLIRSGTNWHEFGGGGSGTFLDSKFLIQDEGDTTKQWDSSVGGATTATKTTLAFSQTLNRIITFPDATDTIVGKATTDIFTNKTINTSNNTITVNLTDVSDVTMTVANLNILDDGVDTTLHFHDSDRARANHTGSQLASTISDFDTQVRTNTLNQMAAPTADLSINNNKLTNVIDPTTEQEAATKNYVDNIAINGVKWKESARVATTANITLSGEQTIDGVSTSADRVLVKNQTLGEDNGVYISDAGAWVRSTDTDTSAEILQMAIFTEEGTVNADQGFVLTTDAPITLGTTPLTYTQFTGLGQITAGTGLTKTGNVLDVGGTTSRISVSADAIDIDSAYIGQSSITTLGTITTGVWNGDAITYTNLSFSNDIVDGDLASGVFGSITGIGALSQTLDINTQILQFVDANTTITAVTNDLEFDVATGNTFRFRINNIVEMDISNSLIDFQNNSLVLGNNADIRWAGTTARQIFNSTTGFIFDVEVGDTFSFDIAGTPEMIISSTQLDLTGNDLNLNGGILQFDDVNTKISQLNLSGADRDIVFDTVTGAEYFFRINDIVILQLTSAQLNVNDLSVLVGTGGNVRFGSSDITISGGGGLDILYDVRTGQSHFFRVDAADRMTINELDGVSLTVRLETDKGVDIASPAGGIMTLGTDGNTFDITGTNTINEILATNWQAGSVIHLQFNGILTVTHNSGGTNDILLGNQANMTTAVGDVLTLYFNAVDWVEISRSVVGGGGASLPVVDTTSIAEGSADATKEVRFEVDGNTTGIIGILATTFTTAKTITFPDATDTLVGKATTDIFTNKTYDADGTGNVLTNVGSSEIKSEMITGQSTVTAVSGDFVLISDTGDSGNLKKVNANDFLAAAGLPVVDTTSIAEGSADATKEVRFEVDGNTTGVIGVIATTFTTAKTFTIPDFTDTAVVLAGQQTITNKIFPGISPNEFENDGLVIQNPSNNRNYTIISSNIADNRTLALPLITGNDTFVTQAMSQTLTNKTITTATFTTGITISNALSWTNSVRQTFSPGSNAGINVGQRAIDISSLTDGDIFYNSGTDKWKGVVNGALQIFVFEALAATLTNKTITLGSNTLSGTVTQFNTALTSETFAYIGVANAWGAVDQNIASTGVWQEAGIDISPIGTQELSVPASGMWSSSTNGALGLNKIELVTNDIDIQTFDFTSTTADEHVQFVWSPPQNWDAGTIRIKFKWSHATGTGNVRWGAQATSLANSDPIDVAWGVIQEVTDANEANNDIILSAFTPAITIAGTPVAGEYVQFRILRSGSDGADTFTATARLHEIIVEYSIDEATAT